MDRVKTALADLSRGELEKFALATLKAMYWDHHPGSWNENREWDADTCSEIAEELPEDLLAAIVVETHAGPA